MGSWESLWKGWGIVGNSRGYSSPVTVVEIASVGHCFVKVGDELRRACYPGGRWEEFESVGGGRLRSDPVLFGLEVYGVGLEGQLVRNAWQASNGSAAWQGWQDLGSPARGILGNPAVQQRLDGLYVVVKGSDNRLYLCISMDNGRSWGEWQQSDKLRGGQFTGDPSGFTVIGPGRSSESFDLVITGRSMEGEMAAISRIVDDADTAAGSLWSDWSVAGNSRGYTSPVYMYDPNVDDVYHCLIKVGDEVRHARFSDGRWDDFSSVDGGRFRSNPVVILGHEEDTIEVYGVGVDGQLARNIWPAHRKSWQGWQDLGRPEQGIVGTPAVETMGRMRFVVAKGRDDRLYLRFSDDGKSWDPWEQGDRLRPGRIKGDVSTFMVDDLLGFSELVVTGRSMENEMASISLKIT